MVRSHNCVDFLSGKITYWYPRNEGWACPIRLFKVLRASRRWLFNWTASRKEERRSILGGMDLRRSLEWLLIWGVDVDEKDTPCCSVAKVTLALWLSWSSVGDHTVKDSAEKEFESESKWISIGCVKTFAMLGETVSLVLEARVASDGLSRLCRLFKDAISLIIIGAGERGYHKK